MTEKLRFGAEEAIRTLRKVVFEKGADYKYRNPEWTQQDEIDGITICKNFHGDEPGCIVGHVLHTLGLDANTAQRLNIAGGASASESAEVLNFVPEFGWDFTDGAINVLTTAQCVQDNQKTWGESLAKAEEKYLKNPLH